MRVWLLTPRGMPLTVIEASGDGAWVLDRLRSAGLAQVGGVYGELPPTRAPRVGFTLTATGLRLDDDRGRAVVRIPPDAVSDEWREAALRRRGTLTYVSGVLAVDDEGPRVVADVLDAAARQGAVLGGVVGVARERTVLPLPFVS